MITRETAHDWMRKHPAFSDAYKKASLLAQEHWEKMLHATALGKIKGNLGAQVFWMKNRFRDQWQDRVEQEIKVGKIEPVVITAGDITETIKLEERYPQDDENIVDVESD